MASKQQVEEQQKFIRHHVPNPHRQSFVELPISHEEYMAARFKSSAGAVGNMRGRFQMKSNNGGTFTDEVDIERTYNILKTNEEYDEEEAEEKRKEKKEKDNDKGCCGAWYCCPFRCSWKLLCSFFG